MFGRYFGGAKAVFGRYFRGAKGDYECGRYQPRVQMVFRFRLQKLMDLRRRTRDQRRADLGQAYEAEQVLQRQQQQLLAEIEQLKTHMRQTARPGEVAVDQLLGAHRYELLLQSQRTLLAQRTDQVTQEVERRRQLLLEAEKEFRVIEKLQEKLQSRYRQETEKQEHRRLDEVALMGRQDEESF